MGETAPPPYRVSVRGAVPPDLVRRVSEAHAVAILRIKGNAPEGPKGDEVIRHLQDRPEGSH